MKKTIILTIVMAAILAMAMSIGIFAAEEATTEAAPEQTTEAATEEMTEAVTDAPVAETAKDSKLTTLFSDLFNGGSIAIIGAALAVGLAGIGSAKGVGMVAEATSGLLTENPNMFGKAFALMALPMTQGIYGLVVAFLIVMKVGLFDQGMAAFTEVLTVQQGAYYLMSALPIAVVGLISAIKQARVAVSGINLLAKRPDQVGKAITSAALVETYAIFALLISVLLVLMG